MAVSAAHAALAAGWRVDAAPRAGAAGQRLAETVALTYAQLLFSRSPRVGALLLLATATRPPAARAGEEERGGRAEAEVAEAPQPVEEGARAGGRGGSGDRQSHEGVSSEASRVERSSRRRMAAWRPSGAISTTAGR